ncbi:dimethylmenaquinone methyltransferase [Actibacterium mucosum KCTC 23349]|uniref:Dimethylmenaquinone methyltransferase n=1 Tax=Actibacterium mucosum KCTC 23349 TaxID=1454373 RepID=A0A037ZNX0_9RHOB|nr:molecular chaperone DjiA [Actibacterium mucosum]KAJ56506.1 dimethylmenaquinone methyltransferase [Actibacterium mucosum KCTC 23349]
MSIWNRIADAVSALAQGESLTEVFDRLRSSPEKSVGFTIAVIALGAKMAKADGQVTRDEVTAFREVFDIPPHAMDSAAKVFNLARQDVAGYEEYAQRIKRMFGDEYQPLVDLVEGLFYIAVADGEYHPNEDEFLTRVSDILGIAQPCFRSLKTRFVPDADPDPYSVLRVTPETPMADIRAAWRHTVRESHPDRLVARGVPEEAIKMAEARLIAVNRAWEEIQQERAA